MSFTHRIKRGSTRPVLRYPLPPGINLTGAQATFIMAPRPGQPAVVNAPAIIASIAPPVVEYAWQQGDTVQDGTFYAEIEVTFPDGGSQTFPEQGYFAVVIDKDLGDGGVFAPPALITLSGALAESTGDTASGSASVAISLSGAMTEAGGDTASGSLSIVVPGAITLSAALVEAGADTASGMASVGITASAAMVESGADTASGEMTVAPAPVTAQRVIILTDYAGDCDDAMALGVACAAHKRGDVEILGIVATSSIQTSAPGVFGQLRAYGMESIPVYAYQGSLGTYNNNISAPVRDAFGVPGQTRAAFEDDVTGMRRMLASAPDASVKVIDIGAPVSSARLLDSPADAISPLTGMELVAAKTTGLWLMSGRFHDSTTEYNATRHIPSTQRVYHDWPTPIYAHGWEVGYNVFTGPPADASPAVDPIKVAFNATISAGYLNGQGKRESWDPIAVHHAIYGNGDLYNFVGANGSITVDANGRTIWAASPAGNRFRMGKAGTPAAIASAIEARVLEGDLTADPPPIEEPPPDPDPDVVEWAFDLTEGVGAEVASGDGKIGTIYDATWAGDPTRLVFSGSPQRVTIPTPPDHATDYILGIVVKLAGVVGDQQFMTMNLATGNQRKFQFRASASALSFVSLTSSGGATVLDAPAQVVAGEWAMFTAHVTSTTVMLRKNGVTVRTGTMPAENRSSAMATVPIHVGARFNPSSQYVDPLRGDVAAFSIRFAASVDDVTAAEAELRAIATAKGITLP